MITSLHIHNLAIIDRLDIEFDDGMTALTGETGAGKSIMVDALGLLLGDRGDSSVIRHGRESADLSVHLSLRRHPSAAQWLEQQQLSSDEECLLRRTLHRERGSRCWINGHPATVQMLKEFGELLVDIHSQHEHQSLTKSSTQRLIVDSFSSTLDEVASLSQLYSELGDLQQRKKVLQGGDEGRESRVQLLEFQLEELDQAGLVEDEITQLENELQRLSHADQLISGIGAACYQLDEIDQSSISDRLGEQLTTLETLAEYDPGLKPGIDLLNESMITLGESVTHLKQHLETIEHNPQRLAEVNQRLELLHDLARKHRVEPERLPARRDELSQEISMIKGSEAELDEIEAKINTIHADYTKQAKVVSKKRTKGAEALSSLISDQMQALGMEGGKFTAHITPHSSSEPTPHGNDHIEFMVSANRGQPHQPLSRVASGGELSRISLAIQVVTAAYTQVATLIFDEVDVGIGGRIAEIVGTRLRELGSLRQVLCVTHLPQVAAQANSQFQVTKTGSDPVEVSILPLDKRSRVNEIARMLGGVKITKQTVEHARDMLKRATG